MAIRYKTLDYASRDHEKVSLALAGLLHDIYFIDKVTGFNINEGHRTYARQLELVRLQGVWSPSNPHGAARPSPIAPHIRTGRADHALDVGGDINGLIAAAANRGVHLVRTIAQEPWHLEAVRSELLAYAKKRRKRLRQEAKQRSAKAKHVREAAAKHAAALAKARRARQGGISDAGLQFIAGFEGFRVGAYQLPGEQYRTIGYGHYGADVKPGATISRREALVLLGRDVKKFSDAVARQFPKLNQNQHDAITSAAFNMGPGILDRGRSLGDALRSSRIGRGNRVAAALRLYVHGSTGATQQGLVNRRNAEINLYRKKVK